jgi:hypothetical protein
VKNWVCGSPAAEIGNDGHTKLLQARSLSRASATNLEESGESRPTQRTLQIYSSRLKAALLNLTPKSGCDEDQGANLGFDKSDRVNPACAGTQDIYFKEEVI